MATGDTGEDIFVKAATGLSTGRSSTVPYGNLRILRKEVYRKIRESVSSTAGSYLMTV
jgi:hypothetical protein